MMASMGPAGFHPGMPQHAGVHPGHPMGAPGMAHNPSQPGTQPGMPPQMAAQMAASGAGGQVNMMAGMPQGAGGPNAHAMHHLNPVFQQQGQPQYMAQNPQMLMQQQRMIAQRQAQMAHMQQQQQQMYANGGNMPMNMQMAGQFQAMRQNPNMQRMIPAHLQQQLLQQQGHANPQQQQLIQHQLALQQQQQAQQQAAANNQMHQGGQPGHPGQMTPQQQLQLQQAQAHQQAQMAAQSMAQQMPSTTAQSQQPQPPPPQPQNQPQSAQQSQPQQPQGQQQPGQQQGPQAQSGPQGPQRAATPATTQGAPGQTQTPATTQPSQPQPAQAQTQGPNSQPNQAQQQNAQLLHQHQQLANLQAMAQNNEKNGAMMKGNCVLKLMQFSEHLSGFPGTKNRDDVSYWHAFVNQFFSHRGIFRHSISVTGSDPANEEHGTDKVYEIVGPALARYFHTHFTSGITQMQLTFEKGTVDRPLANGCHFIENPKTNLIYWFENSHVVASGSLRAHFDAEQKLELLEFITQSHEEFVSRRMVINAARPTHLWAKEWKKVNGQDSMSPEMNKKGKAKNMKSPPNPPPDFVIPHSAVKGNMGITEPVFQYLEIVEVMGQMNPLFQFCQTQATLSPYQALEQYVQTVIANGQPQMNGNMQPSQRTPSFQQFPMGASPAASHLQLPNSPHMGSPAQAHMQAPGMQVQHSQQGTNSGGPSANTSPASNKRRRPSTVKAEEESGAPTPATMGGPQVNGVAMAGKKPPTPRMQKRQKQNPT